MCAADRDHSQRRNSKLYPTINGTDRSWELGELPYCCRGYYSRAGYNNNRRGGDHIYSRGGYHDNRKQLFRRLVLLLLFQFGSLNFLFEPLRRVVLGHIFVVKRQRLTAAQTGTSSNGTDS